MLERVVASQPGPKMLKKAQYTDFQGRDGDHNDLALPGAITIGVALALRAGKVPFVMGSPQHASNVGWRVKLDVALPLLRITTRSSFIARTRRLLPRLRRRGRPSGTPRPRCRPLVFIAQRLGASSGGFRGTPATRPPRRSWPTPVNVTSRAASRSRGGAGGKHRHNDGTVRGTKIQRL